MLYDSYAYNILHVMEALLRMKCRLKYTHPVTGNTYYFLDLRFNGSELRPIGCLSYRKQYATIFHTKRDALKVSEYLVSLGYIRVSII